MKKEHMKSVLGYADESGNWADKVLEKANFTDTIKNGDAVNIAKLRGRRVKKNKLEVVSVRISQELVQKLQEAGDSRGIGYQTMLRQILMENIDGYLKRD